MLGTSQKNLFDTGCICDICDHLCVYSSHFAEDIAFGKAAGVSTVLVDPEGRHQGASSMSILAEMIRNASFGQIVDAFAGKSLKQNNPEGSRSVDCVDGLGLWICSSQPCVLRVILVKTSSMFWPFPFLS